MGLAPVVGWSESTKLSTKGDLVATTTQLFTLLGVVVGAVASYLVNALGERARFRRDLARNWQERRFDCFASYINEVKSLSIIARRMAPALGLPSGTSLDPLNAQDGARLLTETETHRALSMEKLRLLADANTAAAAHTLNEAVWRLDGMARGLITDLTLDQWNNAVAGFFRAFDEFHTNARRELGVPGRHTSREIVLIAEVGSSVTEL